MNLFTGAGTWKHKPENFAIKPWVVPVKIIKFRTSFSATTKTTNTRLYFLDLRRGTFTFSQACRKIVIFPRIMESMVLVRVDT